jgi:cytidylate kinase
MKHRPVITIDGPAGAGKSTISRLLSERLCFVYLDTGALYRAVAYWLFQNGFSENGDELPGQLAQLQVTLNDVQGQLHVFVGGEDVSERIRTEKIGLLASRISALPAVREALLSVQQGIGASGGVVAEGRDMGTVVFPDAGVKFFLDASVQERAGRRYRELLARGDTPLLSAVEADLRLRDCQDTERSISPLRIPADAVIVDTTTKTIPQVVDFMMGVLERLGIA